MGYIISMARQAIYLITEGNTLLSEEAAVRVAGKISNSTWWTGHLPKGNLHHH